MKDIINNINNFEDFSSFIKANADYKLVLVKFSTKWCQPCKRLQITFNDLKKERKDILFLEFDAEKYIDLAKDKFFNVLTVPSMFLFQKGIMTRRIEGYIEIEELKSLLI